MRAEANAPNGLFQTGRAVRVKAYEGLPVEAEGVEDAEEAAAILGEIGELMKRLGIKRVVLEGELVVGEG